MSNITLYADIINIMDFNRLEEILETEKLYRRDQVWKSVFQDLLEDWEKATNLPLRLRKTLNRISPLSIEGSISCSKTGDSVKAVLKMDDGVSVESVLMQHIDKRNTICFIIAGRLSTGLHLLQHR